jgi:hypothetical protein
MESNLRDREDVEDFIRSIMMPGAKAILAGGEAQPAVIAVDLTTNARRHHPVPHRRSALAQRWTCHFYLGFL